MTMRIQHGVGLALMVVLGAAAVVTSAAPQRAGAQGAARAATFSDTIAPILYANCVACHRPGEVAPFSLIAYEDVAKRGRLIAKVTSERYMPPWHAAAGHGEFVGERRLTDAQIASIGRWVEAGMPRGDAAKMPKLPDFPADGWRLGQPDLVLEMPVAFDLSASGPDVFRNFVIPTNLAEDKWVRGIEFRPSARKVVHHAIFAHVPGGTLASRDGADGRPGFGGMETVGIVNARGDSSGLGGWAVGATPMMFPEGLAVKLPKGADFLLQMHFHLSGKPETEKSLIGVYFADRPPNKDIFTVELPALFAFGAGIDIPPGEKRFTLQDSFTVPGDVKIYSATAHAHYLAKDMKATATLPDGTTKPLLWIDDWDFNWQDSYVYKVPFTLPAGTRIDATISYDNSAENPRNPVDPPRRALWGEQSVDEMGTIGFTFEVLQKPDVPRFQSALAARNKAAIAAAGQNGTLQRFLARQKRQTMGLQQLTIYDRSGSVVGRVGEPGLYSQASFSPDGGRLAVIKTDPDRNTEDVWTFDIATGKGTAVTEDEPIDSAPVWSHDGQHVAYVSARDNVYGIYRRAANGQGGEELLYRHTTAASIVLTDWSVDGRFLGFWNGDTMFILPLQGERKPIQLAKEDFFGRGGRLSPDGRFLAFNSNRSGRFQVYVSAIDPATGLRGPSAVEAGTSIAQISTDGGIGGIVWRKDGKELFYLSQPPKQTVMVVDVSGGRSAGTPQRLFELPAPIGAPAQLSDISSPDGQRFVFAVNVRKPPAPPAPPR